MDRLEFFEKLHLRELARRDAFTPRLTAPISIMGAMAGALGYLLISFRFGGLFASPLRGWNVAYWLVEWTFMLCTALAAAALLRGAYCVARVMLDQSHEYMPDAKLLHGHLVNLTAYHRARGARRPVKLAEADFTAYLIDKFIACAESNWHKNKRQFEILYHGQLMISLTLAFLVVALLCYYMDQKLDPVDVPKIEQSSQWS